jgi:hypothetical protein
MNLPVPPARLLPLIAAIALGGCIHMPSYTASLTGSELRQVSEFDLCAAYASTESKRLRTEIDRRNLISPEEWTKVAGHQVTEGMSTCSVLASLGFPATVEEEEEATSPNGFTTRLVYLDDLLVITYQIKLRGGVAVEIRQ